MDLKRKIQLSCGNLPMSGSTVVQTTFSSSSSKLMLLEDSIILVSFQQL